ncbi:hypothetical protein [Dialister sp.]|uniref:hypothetical protein n=1 Tax=Dialister sp. TaxID=1955814 RepID=UPI00406D51BF
MSFYEDLVMQTQMNFQKYYGIYRRGGTPYELAGPSKLSMDEKNRSSRSGNPRCGLRHRGRRFPAFLRLAAAISTMKITIPSRNTSARFEEALPRFNGRL